MIEERHPQPQIDRSIAHISCVKHTFEDGSHVELCGLDFVVEPGRRVALLGPNGSGKTTLLYHLLGLLRPAEGSVTVMGVDPARDYDKVRRRVGVVLQHVDDQLLAPTVWDDVSFSPRQYGLPAAEVEERTMRALRLLEIEHLRDKVPHYLSGGEKRKVALAGALAMEPDLLILDEPFEGLDPSSRRHVLALLNRLVAERGMTMILSTHDVNLVPELADEVYVLAHGGAIVMHGTPLEVFLRVEQLRAANIEPPILAQLFEQIAARTGRRLPVPGSVDEAAERLAELAGELGGELTDELPGVDQGGVGSGGVG